MLNKNSQIVGNYLQEKHHHQIFVIEELNQVILFILIILITPRKAKNKKDQVNKENNSLKQK